MLQLVKCGFGTFQLFIFRFIRAREFYLQDLRLISRNNDMFLV